jgi:ATP-dependent DNA helicase RecQ
MKSILAGISSIFQNCHQTCILLAPAGSGKTTLTIEYFEQTKNSIVFVSPLRALAQELSARLNSLGIDNYCPTSFLQAKEQVATIQKLPNASPDAFFLIITPEVFNDEWWTLTIFEQKNVLVVIDECHLFFYWGDSFRPRLQEFLDNLICTQHNILFLTATLETNLKIRLKELLHLQRENIYLLDIGNQQILRQPKIIRYIPQQLISSLIHAHLDTSNVTSCIIIFCRYRSEVLSWEQHLKSFGFDVLSCLGGESLAFREKLINSPNPQIIIATSVLGHGVNLPRCHLVVMTFHEENPDLALQMLARGGRQGEEYWCLKPLHRAYFIKEKRLQLQSIWTCVRDLSQCTLAILYGWFCYPSLSTTHDRNTKDRRFSPQENTLSRKAFAGDTTIATGNAKDCFILWWSRWWQNAKRLRTGTRTHD